MHYFTPPVCSHTFPSSWYKWDHFAVQSAAGSATQLQAFEKLQNMPALRVPPQWLHPSQHHPAVEDTYLLRLRAPGFQPDLQQPQFLLPVGQSPWSQIGQTIWKSYLLPRLCAPLNIAFTNLLPEFVFLVVHSPHLFLSDVLQFHPLALLHRAVVLSPSISRYWK